MPETIVTPPVLDIRDLWVSYNSDSRSNAAVSGLNVRIGNREAVALVGESGCGKSTTAMSILRLLPKGAAVEGAIEYLGQDLAKAPEKLLRQVRGNGIGIIFQEPMSSLNPVYTVGAQIVETLRLHLALSRGAAKARAIELLDLVKLPDPAARFSSFPHELSGGQRQRVMIAMAIACEPKLLIADEPTTALDATVQEQILELIDGLRRDLDMSLLLISHDLPVVSKWADRVVVMHHGQALEELGARGLFEDGQHAYTRGLIDASIRISDVRHYRDARLSEIRTTREHDGTYRFGVVTPELRGSIPADTQAGPVLSVENLVVAYDGRHRSVTAVDDVSFEIKPGETLGLVGESGSGKSTLSKAVLRLVPARSGRIIFNGEDILGLGEQALRAKRREIQMVFQDPFSSLNPRHSVADILENVLLAHGFSDRAARHQRIVETLDSVKLPRTALQSYPHEFSGGQRQRIAIARALILRPRLLICDEPVSALDVSIQAQILNLLADIKAEFGMSALFISHDLAVVRYVSDRVMVMSKGTIVEENDYRTIWTNPSHPYTQTLVAAAS